MERIQSTKRHEEKALKIMIKSKKFLDDLEHKINNKSKVVQEM